MPYHISLQQLYKYAMILDPSYTVIVPGSKPRSRDDNMED